MCIKKCKANHSCESVSWSKSEGICKFHSSSPYSNHFNGKIIKNHSWRLFIPEPVSTLTWKTVAKFSTFSGHFQGKYSYELWNSPLDFVNNTHCRFMSKAERCNNRYVHKGKDFLMELKETTKVKVSLYKNDAEAAFVMFEKKSIPNDNWFQTSRVIDSYPWDVELLKSSAEMSLKPQENNQDTRFYIVKSKPGYPLRRHSPHSYWMKIYESSKVDICQYGLIDTPYILYGKGPGPNLLSKSAVSLIIN